MSVTSAVTCSIHQSAALIHSLLCDCDASSLSRSANFLRKDRRPNLLKSRKLRNQSLALDLCSMKHPTKVLSEFHLQSAQAPAQRIVTKVQVPWTNWCRDVLCRCACLQNRQTVHTPFLSQWFEAQNWSYKAFTPRPNLLPFPWPLQHPRR